MSLEIEQGGLLKPGNYYVRFLKGEGTVTAMRDEYGDWYVPGVEYSVNDPIQILASVPCHEEIKEMVILINELRKSLLNLPIDVELSRETYDFMEKALKYKH